MPDRTWKKAERKVAELLGGQRIPVSGRGDRPDIEHGWLSIECKLRRRLPQWLLAAVEQAERAARPGQLPVAILHQAGARYRDALVVLRLGEFEEWFGGVRQKGGRNEPR